MVQWFHMFTPHRLLLGRVDAADFLWTFPVCSRPLCVHISVCSVYHKCFYEAWSVCLPSCSRYGFWLQRNLDLPVLNVCGPQPLRQHLNRSWKVFHTCAIKGSCYCPLRSRRSSQLGLWIQTKTPFSGRGRWWLGPGSKHSPMEREVPSHPGRRLFCLRYAEHVCSLWVAFAASDVDTRTTSCPSEAKQKWNMLVWKWICVARLERALKYLPVRVFQSGQPVYGSQTSVRITFSFETLQNEDKKVPHWVSDK